MTAQRFKPGSPWKHVWNVIVWQY